MLGDGEVEGARFIGIKPPAGVELGGEADLDDTSDAPLHMWGISDPVPKRCELICTIMAYTKCSNTQSASIARC